MNTKSTGRSVGRGTDTAKDAAAARWVRAPDQESAHLVGSGISPLLARLLAGREIRDYVEARGFLEPSIADLHEPRLLLGVDPAVATLLGAKENGEKVAIVGDYDADGVTATAILLVVFRACGLRAEHILPHRMSEGYGFQIVHVDRAEREGVKVIVTADCGTRSHEATKKALDAGLAVIVTDHHIPGEPLDERVIQINPNQTGCSYPFGELSGAGLALKLAMALAEAANRPVDPMALLRVACLGTIADLVPLRGENRAIAALGLQSLADTHSAGLRSLMAVAGVTPPIRASDVGFRLGPRLNAAGRMDAPDAALALLLERDPVNAQSLADRLNNWNEERQRTEREVVAEAREPFLESTPPFLLAWNESWHRGVLGIAAGRLAREFHRPTVLLSVEEGLAVGSGRSIPGVHLHDFLSVFEDDFERFGGHAQAIGLSVAEDRLGELRRRILEAAGRWPADTLIPVHQYEEALETSELTIELVQEIDRLEPFGVKNRRPMFRFGPLESPLPPREFGSDHLGLRARGQDGSWIDLVAWRWANRRELFREPFEVVGRLTIDSYLGRPSVELVDARSV